MTTTAKVPHPYEVVHDEVGYNCRLPMFEHCQHGGLENSRWLEARVVNLPSSVPESEFGRLRAPL